MSGKNSSKTAGQKRRGKIQTISGSPDSRILLIAPHGVIHDDKNGYADPNKVAHINGSKELKGQWLDWIEGRIRQIVARHGTAFIVHIHGIDPENIKRVADITDGFKNRREDLHVLLGYGQNKRGKALTADERALIRPLIDTLGKNGMYAVSAPLEPITDKNGRKRKYCGDDPKRLNRWLFAQQPKVQCVQLEITASDFRDSKQEAIRTAEGLSLAMAEIALLGVPEAVFRRVEWRSPDDLRPHPLNQELYGNTDTVEDLLAVVKDYGITEPLRITTENVVISGHRRLAVALKLGLETVPVIIDPDTDPLSIEAKLISSNVQRKKTREQIGREFGRLMEIETEKAKQRQRSAGGDTRNRKAVPQNSAEAVKGDARQIAAAKLGISHDTGEKSLKVVQVTDRLKAEGKIEEAAKIVKLLNDKSVKSAHEAIQGLSKTESKGSVFNRTTESIEWASWTWNPVTGCKHGCQYCYARTMAHRFPEKYPKGFEPDFHQERLAAAANTKVPNSKHLGDRSVFVVSMGDLFGDWVPQEWIDQVLDTVRKQKQWNYMFLTKNPKRLVDIDWPDNAWVGTTVDCQARVKPAEEAFEKIKARVKFVSCEPLSEELKFERLDLFDWVIIGARSQTSGAPAMQPEAAWVRSLIGQAWAAGCQVYCKPNLKAGIKEYPV